MKTKFMKALDENIAAVQQVNIVRHTLPDDGTFPNNALLPLLVLKRAVGTSDSNVIKEILESNRWGNSWEDGIYDYHHYHSTAHEVLVVVKGSALIQFGGPSGKFVSVEQGDVIIIPAGVAHKCDEADDDFTVVGAYPEGQDYDILKGKDNDRPKADENIRNVKLPVADPLYGIDGPLLRNWT